VSKKRVNTGVHKFRAQGRPVENILYSGAQYLWVRSIKLASCHLYGAWNLEVAPTFVENFCVPELTRITFKDLFRNTQLTHSVSIIKTNQLIQ
jgi:hypothetical protein